jgi:hypothetical protein
MKKILLLNLFIASMFVAFSQSLSIETSLDSNKLLIGDQTLLIVKVTVPKTKSEIVFPKYSDTLQKGVEVVNRSKIDTIANDAQKYILKQTLTVTSFDSGSYNIKIGPFVINGKDSMFANPISLYVNTLKVDTAKDVKDIKAPLKAPLEWAEIWPWLRWFLLGLVIIGIMVYFLWRYFSRKDNYESVKTMEPPHTIAFRELERLKAEHLLEDGQIKEYHSRVSEIIRAYIESRFSVNALELPSDEVLDIFRNSDLVNNELFNQLKQLLKVADLAKFAKYIPVENENELSLKNAYNFVNETMVIIEKAKVDVEVEQKEDIITESKE